MAERSFARDVASLELGEGEEFRGEGILAVAKALLQCGISYVGGYPGAPVSHLVDVFKDARHVLDSLGIHLEICANEASAAAMLGASVNYPIRGVATWKSTVGTNVASDALSNLGSNGVTGGALIILGEDYGEGSSIIQERSHAFAMKSQLWLIDPRPNLESIVSLVEKSFELSEASSTPVMLELRVRACHVYGHFQTKNNRRGHINSFDKIKTAAFDYGKISLPPSIYSQEHDKIDRRWPAAVKFIREHRLNEVFNDDFSHEVGVIVQGGIYNGVARALKQLGLVNSSGSGSMPIYCLNVTYPLVPDEITEFCQGKRAVLIVEEGQPAYIEDAINSILRKADAPTRLFGKDVLPAAGDYTIPVIRKGIASFLAEYDGRPDSASSRDSMLRQKSDDATSQAAKLMKKQIPARPPNFCVGCPERPVFAAIKLLQRETGDLHVAADVGCHTFAALPPFELGNTTMGFGLGLSSAAGIGPHFDKRVVSIMGDGGFWHNGLTSGVVQGVQNEDDGVLIVLNNGFAAATGGQEILSSPKHADESSDGGRAIVRAARSIGVSWAKRVRSYDVAGVANMLRSAMNTPASGPKLIVADGECQLARQRRIKPVMQERINQGQRVVRPRFDVDEDCCTGDHSCIRLSGCPSLTVQDSKNPLKKVPVAKVDHNCVGCGLCGEVAHAAALCPSFYLVETISNASWAERFLFRIRRCVIGILASSREVRA
jgi:indolepyruvate ferredoxin oxidoreductase, alpha subunit